MIKVITITGASGSGKDTLVDGLLCVAGVKDITCLPEGLRDSVKGIKVKKKIKVKELISHTTRQPRQGEQDGVDYYYVTKEVIDKLGKVEFTEYAGNYYCLSEEELNNLGDKIGVVIVDKHGVECISDYADKHDVLHITVFLPIEAELSEQRMVSRGDNQDRVGQRLKQQEVRQEYNAVRQNGDLFDYVIYNEQGLEGYTRALKALVDIVVDL